MGVGVMSDPKPLISRFTQYKNRDTETDSFAAWRVDRQWDDNPTICIHVDVGNLRGYTGVVRLSRHQLLDMLMSMEDES